jgi:hypothetical protein
MSCLAICPRRPARRSAYQPLVRRGGTELLVHRLDRQAEAAVQPAREALRLRRDRRAGGGVIIRDPDDQPGGLPLLDERRDARPVGAGSPASSVTRARAWRVRVLPTATPMRRRP